MLSIVFVLLLVCLVAGLIVDGIRSAPRQVIAATAAFSPPEVVLAWARTSFAAAARRYGYRLVFADDTQLVFEREWRPMAVCS